MNISLSENSYCMTNDIDSKYKFRYQLLCEWFKVENIKPPIKVVVNDQQSYVQACTNGHLKILNIAIEKNLPYVVVFEDDAYPCINVNEKFNSYLKEIEQYNIDWGCLAIGRAGDTSGWKTSMRELYANESEEAKKFNTFEGYKSEAKFLSPNVFTLNDGFHGSHAYIVKNGYYQHAIERFNYGHAADATMTYGPLKMVCTKECLFLQKNAYRYVGPKYYNENYTGTVVRGIDKPIGFR